MRFGRLLCVFLFVLFVLGITGPARADLITANFARTDGPITLADGLGHVSISGPQNTDATHRQEARGWYLVRSTPGSDLLFPRRNPRPVSEPSISLIFTLGVSLVGIVAWRSRQASARSASSFMGVTDVQPT